MYSNTESQALDQLTASWNIAGQGPSRSNQVESESLAMDQIVDSLNAYETGLEGRSDQMELDFLELEELSPRGHNTNRVVPIYEYEEFWNADHLNFDINTLL